MNQRFILAEWPMKADCSILVNALMPSKEDGIRRATELVGRLERIKIAEMDGVQTRTGRRFMIFFGEAEIDMLDRWITDGLPDIYSELNQ